MGLFSRLTGRTTTAPPVALRLPAIFDEGTFTGDDGGPVWASGYTLVDPNGRFMTPESPELAELGIRLMRVAGAATHHAQTLARDDFAPGRPLILRPNPSKQYPDAVGVWDGRGQHHVGFIPRQEAAEVAASFRGGQPLGGVVLREYRASPSGQRTGLRILVCPVGDLELVLDDEDDDEDLD